MNLNTETGRLSARRPNLQNQPAMFKDHYRVREAFTCAPGNSLLVCDYGQLELRLLAHMSNCTVGGWVGGLCPQSILDARASF
jgi:DNA polymerase-1